MDEINTYFTIEVDISVSLISNNLDGKKYIL